MTAKPQEANTGSALRSVVGVLAGLAGAVGGWTLTQYAGGSLIIPGISAALLLVIFHRTSLGPRFFRGAISVTIGHVMWFVAAALYLGTWAPVMLDVLLLTVGVIWLWVRPGLAPVIFLGAFEVLSFASNTFDVLSVEVGSVAHRALVVHLLLRAIVLACLAVEYQRFKVGRI